MAAQTAANKKLDGLRVRKLDGKIVKPTLYFGRHVGYGKYFAASVDGVMLLDENGKPRPFRSVGTMENA